MRFADSLIPSALHSEYRSVALSAPWFLKAVLALPCAAPRAEHPSLFRKKKVRGVRVGMCVQTCVQTCVCRLEMTHWRWLAQRQVWRTTVAAIIRFFGTKLTSRCLDMSIHMRMDML